MGIGDFERNALRFEEEVPPCCSILWIDQRAAGPPIFGTVLRRNLIAFSNVVLGVTLGFSFQKHAVNWQLFDGCSVPRILSPIISLVVLYFVPISTWLLFIVTVGILRKAKVLRGVVVPLILLCVPLFTAYYISLFADFKGTSCVIPDYLIVGQMLMFQVTAFLFLLIAVCLAYYCALQEQNDYTAWVTRMVKFLSGCCLLLAAGAALSNTFPYYWLLASLLAGGACMMWFWNLPQAFRRRAWE